MKNLKINYNSMEFIFYCACFIAMGYSLATDQPYYAIYGILCLIVGQNFGLLRKLEHIHEDIKQQKGSN